MLFHAVFCSPFFLARAEPPLELSLIHISLGRVILHLHERTEGRIVFQGEDISDVSNAKLKELRKDMQIIFQDPYASLNPRMSIGDIIAEPVSYTHLARTTRANFGVDDSPTASIRLKRLEPSADTMHIASSI